MNDKIIMENMLLLLKSTVEVYVHGSLESNALKSNLDEIIKMQDELYKKMTECGWYIVTNIDSKQIQKTLKKLQKN